MSDYASTVLIKKMLKFRPGKCPLTHCVSVVEQKEPCDRRLWFHHKNLHTQRKYWTNRETGRQQRELEVKLNTELLPPLSFSWCWLQTLSKISFSIHMDASVSINHYTVDNNIPNISLYTYFRSCWGKMIKKKDFWVKQNQIIGHWAFCSNDMWPVTSTVLEATGGATFRSRIKTDCLKNYPLTKQVTSITCDHMFCFVNVVESAVWGLSMRNVYTVWTFHMEKKHTKPAAGAREEDRQTCYDT